MSSPDPNLPSDRHMLCAMCPSPGLNCIGCLAIRYCSKECQKNDWPIHKLVCKTLRDFSLDKRPGANYTRAIHFPLNGERPQFFWLRFAVPEDTGYDHTQHSGNDVPLIESSLDIASPFSSIDAVPVEVKASIVLNRPLEREMRLAGKLRGAEEKEDIPEHEINRSLSKINSELQDVWYGEVVAYGLQATADGLLCRYDTGPLEFRHAVDAMRFMYDEVQTKRLKTVQGPTVMGAWIGTVGDTEIFDRDPISILPVSASQCSAESDLDTVLCECVGIPLVCRRIPLGLTGRDRRTGDLPQDMVGIAPPLHPLNPRLPVTSKLHGFGGAIVVRKDGRPLHRAHIHALAEYGMIIADSIAGQGVAKTALAVDTCEC